MFLLLGCDGTQCDEQSEKVKFAKSLSQERLYSLFESIKKYRSEGHTHPFEKGSQHSPIPKEFSDIDPLKIRVERKLPTIMLEGCFDHFVLLLFYGVEEEGKGKILLQWGEGSTGGRQLLWQEEN